MPYRGAAPDWKHGLLVRRSVLKPDERAYYFIHAPPHDTGLADLVRVAGARWTVEASFEAAGGKVGLDQCEVRGSTAWHRHITLAMLAHAYLASSARTAPRRSGGKTGPALAADLAAELLPHTVPEMRRLIWRLAWAGAAEPAAVLAWSRWRRTHQQRARRCHWQRRTRSDELRF